jgi:hypothetical protein
MATGTAASVYSLCHLDCGVGKTQAIVAYVQTVLEDHQAGLEVPGMVIFSDRLDDLYTFPTKSVEGKLIPARGILVDMFPTEAEREAAKKAELFGVFTSCRRRNALGAEPEVSFPDIETHNRLPLLFATQERLIRRCADYRSFEAVPHYWFQAKPRPVRVWDEAAWPAKPLSLDPEVAMSLVPGMRRLNPDLADRFFADMVELKGWQKDTLFGMRFYSNEFDVDDDAIYRCAPNIADVQAAALAVCRLQGQVGIVRRDKYTKETTILSFYNTLPDDLAPMVVCDANGVDRRGILTP